MIVESILPRPRIPLRPQFVRSEWLNLNGLWQFEVDAGDSGFERGLVQSPLKETIQVPFCPESTLSGIGRTDFLEAVWYRRSVEIPAGWAGKQVLLHFQAVDYDATVWVNGIEVARHRGGFTPITCNLNGIAQPGETLTIVVRARDDHRQAKPRGKQSSIYPNQGCEYTRTTGIWQTVWLEPVASTYLQRTKITPDLTHHTIRLQQPISGNRRGMTLKAALFDAAGLVAEASCTAEPEMSPFLDLVIPEERVQLWTPETPSLYDLQMSLSGPSGKLIDQVNSYTGFAKCDHRRSESDVEWRGPIPTPGAGPGFLSGRDPDRPQ